MIGAKSFSKYSPVRKLDSATKQGTSSLVELFLKILRTFLARGGRGTLLKPSSSREPPRTPERAPARERVDSVIVESDDEASDARSPRSPISLRLEEESNEPPPPPALKLTRGAEDAPAAASTPELDVAPLGVLAIAAAGLAAAALWQAAFEEPGLRIDGVVVLATWV
eukprot:CAMPEP_0119280694 /NCGR_PEP_ID=MMETSP1329-20130426/23231_1 /TAXON_ID=114041 /ORGANISM="Genus nov. species nov., Strain RCC1024" /LENGTH=167 /DNA_ID=CAMNT_0007281291 /DNA_START=300 /DNA_END=800 /DNA_ORIENTATION=+